MSMKCLLLSTATGQGHNAAAAAVAEALRAENCAAETMDVLNSGKRKVSRKVSGLYAHITVHEPRIFRVLYRAGERISSPKRRSPIFYLNALYAKRLYEKICRFEPDVLVCTHIFSAQSVTHIREKYGLDIPCVGVATDYACTPFWEESALDRYIIPSDALMDEFAGKGIPKEKLVPIGIPVRTQFRRKIPKRDARRKFGLSSDRVFLVMGGSMGYGKIGELTAGLLAAVPGSQVAVLCGKNGDLFRRISEITGAVPFRYTDDVGPLMDAADVVLTKPGGLSSTEALVKRVPTVLTHPIPGCEQQNAAFLSSIGAAVFADDTESAVRDARRLLCDAGCAEKMTEAQKKYIRKDTGRRIGDFLIDFAKSRKKG